MKITWFFDHKLYIHTKTMFTKFFWGRWVQIRRPKFPDRQGFRISSKKKSEHFSIHFPGVAGVFPNCKKVISFFFTKKHYIKNVTHPEYLDWTKCVQFSRLVTVFYRRIYPVIENLILPSQNVFFLRKINYNKYSYHYLDVQVDVIYANFLKAFDRIDHNIFFDKLINIGFSDNAVIFLKSHVSNRIYFVAYNEFMSKSYLASSGVTQGSNFDNYYFVSSLKS